MRLYNKMIEYASKNLQTLAKSRIFSGMSTVAKNFRIDSELNDQANKLLEGLGLSMSQAVSMFLRQVVLHRGLPFKVEYPQYPKELIDAMEEGDRLAHDPNAKTYSSHEELLEELGIKL